MSCPDLPEPSLANPNPPQSGPHGGQLLSIRAGTARVTGGGQYPIGRNCGCGGGTQGRHAGIGGRVRECSLAAEPD